jgi:hypothetical protein
MMRRAGFSLLVAGIAAGGVLVGLAEPAAAVSVSTEAELRAAFATDTSIDVEADITLTDCTGGGDVARLTGADPVTIDGHGHVIEQTCPQRVFFQGGSGLMTVQNLKMTGGHAPGNGGGILAASPLALVNASVIKNQTSGAGGGVASDGPTTIIASTVDSNISSGVGGGISTGPNAHNLIVTNSTVADNVGGGIGTPADDQQASVTIVNSTITGNTNGGASRGSGVFTGGSTRLVYATVVDNKAAAFDNLVSHTLESFGSVIAGGGGANCFASARTSHGYNFSDDASCGFTDPTDRESAGDPLLGPLADNGGPTPTLLPQPGSPLIDVIPIASCQADGAAGITSDQRGVTRPQGPGCDIGAVEVEVVVPPVPPVPPPPPPAPPPSPVTVTPRFTG